MILYNYLIVTKNVLVMENDEISIKIPESTDSNKLINNKS